MDIRCDCVSKHQTFLIIKLRFSGCVQKLGMGMGTHSKHLFEIVYRLRQCHNFFLLMFLQSNEIKGKSEMSISIYVQGY